MSKRIARENAGIIDAMTKRDADTMLLWGRPTNSHPIVEGGTGKVCPACTGEGGPHIATCPWSDPGGVGRFGR